MEKIWVGKRVFVENPLPLKGKIILKFKIQEEGGEQSSGTYKHIESNDYEFDYGGGSDNFTIIVEKNTMKDHSSGKDTICEYTKVDKIRNKYENPWE